MTTDGQLLYLRKSNDLPSSYWPVKYIAPDTLMYMGEPDSLATHFWNMKTNKSTDFPNIHGHHDMIYNPITHTFLTFQDYIRAIDGHQVLMDHGGSRGAPAVRFRADVGVPDLFTVVAERVDSRFPTRALET